MRLSRNKILVLVLSSALILSVVWCWWSFPQNKNKQIAVWDEGKIVWQSPAEWSVDNYVWADSNNDGVIDLNLSVWKAGNFGPSKPFWVKENDMAVRNHFFVLDFVDGKMKPVWQSSNLEAPNCQFEITDIDNDGKNELITLEGDYSQPKCEAKYRAIWKWNGWGFSNEWRGEKNDLSKFDSI